MGAGGYCTSKGSASCGEGRIGVCSVWPTRAERVRPSGDSPSPHWGNQRVNWKSAFRPLHHSSLRMLEGVSPASSPSPLLSQGEECLQLTVVLIVKPLYPNLTRPGLGDRSPCTPFRIPRRVRSPAHRTRLLPRTLQDSLELPSSFHTNPLITCSTQTTQTRPFPDGAPNPCPRPHGPPRPAVST